MILLTDSRQQASKHKKKNEYFLQNGITINRVTLTCGDYQIVGKSDTAVDTKKDIHELIGDIQIRQMPKKEIKEKINDILSTSRINADKEKIFNIICDDDSDRFPESEITKWCFENGIEELTEKFKMLYVKRHGFFHRGLIRAKQYNVKLYILVENRDGIASINDLFSWVNPRSFIQVRTNNIIGYKKGGYPIYERVKKYPNCMMGAQLAKACITMQNKYGCEFVFCTPDEAPAKIIELLKGGNT